MAQVGSVGGRWSAHPFVSVLRVFRKSRQENRTGRRAGLLSRSRRCIGSCTRFPPSRQQGSSTPWNSTGRCRCRQRKRCWLAGELPAVVPVPVLRGFRAASPFGCNTQTGGGSSFLVANTSLGLQRILLQRTMCCIPARPGLQNAMTPSEERTSAESESSRLPHREARSLMGCFLRPTL